MDKEQFKAQLQEQVQKYIDAGYSKDEIQEWVDRQWKNWDEKYPDNPRQVPQPETETETEEVEEVEEDVNAEQDDEMPDWVQPILARFNNPNQSFKMAEREAYEAWRNGDVNWWKLLEDPRSEEEKLGDLQNTIIDLELEKVDEAQAPVLKKLEEDLNSDYQDLIKNSSEMEALIQDISKSIPLDSYARVLAKEMDIVNNPEKYDEYEKKVKTWYSEQMQERLSASSEYQSLNESLFNQAYSKYAPTFEALEGVRKELLKEKYNVDGSTLLGRYFSRYTDLGSIPIGEYNKSVEALESIDRDDYKSDEEYDNAIAVATQRKNAAGVRLFNHQEMINEKELAFEPDSDSIGSFTNEEGEIDWSKVFTAEGIRGIGHELYEQLPNFLTAMNPIKGKGASVFSIPARLWFFGMMYNENRQGIINSYLDSKYGKGNWGKDEYLNFIESDEYAKIDSENRWQSSWTSQLDHLANENIITGELSKHLKKGVFTKFASNLSNKAARIAASGTLRIGTGAFLEKQTEQIQELISAGLEDRIKSNFEQSTTQYMNSYYNPFSDSVIPEEIEKRVNQAGSVALLTGGIASTITNFRDFRKDVSDLYKKFAPIQTQENNKKFLNEGLLKIKELYDNGEINLSQANEAAADLKASYDAAEKLTEDLPQEKRKEAFDIIRERDAISNKIKGKDPLLVYKEKEQIKNLNNRLGALIGIETGTDGKADDQNPNTGTGNNIASTPTPDLDTRLQTLENEDGGTLNINGTDYDFTKSGKSLVVPLVSENFKASEVNSEKLQQFLDKNKKFLINDDVKVGFYKFKVDGEDTVSFDLNYVVGKDNKNKALEIAKELGQESLFDLDGFKNYKTGATGANPRTPSVKEFKEIVDSFEEQVSPGEKVLGQIEEGIELDESRNENIQDSFRDSGGKTKTTTGTEQSKGNKGVGDVSSQRARASQREARYRDALQRLILKNVAPDIEVTKDSEKGTSASTGIAKILDGVMTASASININQKKPRFTYAVGEEYAHTYTTAKILADHFGLKGFEHLSKIDSLMSEIEKTESFKKVVASILAEGQYHEQAVNFMNDVNKMAKEIGSDKVMTLEEAAKLTALNEGFSKETGKAFDKFVKNGYDKSKLNKGERSLLDKVLNFFKEIFKDLGLYLTSEKELYSALESNLLEILLDPNSYLNINSDNVIGRVFTGTDIVDEKVYNNKRELEADLKLKGREYDVARRAVVNREYDGKPPKDKEGKHKLLQETARQILLNRSKNDPSLIKAKDELEVIQLVVEQTLADPKLKSIKKLIKGDKKKTAAKIAIAVANLDGQPAAGLENAIANGVMVPIPPNLDIDTAGKEALSRATAAANIISSLTERNIITLRKERKGQWHTHVVDGNLINKAYDQGMAYLDKVDGSPEYTKPYVGKAPADWTNNKHESGLDAITKGSKKVPQKSLDVLNKAKNIPRYVNTKLLEIVEKTLDSPLLTYSDKLMSDNKRKIKSAPLMDTIRRAKAIGSNVYYALSKFDSRGRLNQMTTNLATETNKLSKALGYLEPKEIGLHGWNQMLIQLSDTEGEFEGQTNEERIAYAESKLDEWLEMRDGTLNPFEGMDEPFLFIATLEEVNAALESGDKFSFKSGLPIRKDATVSQGQQIAGFTKNRVLAEKLNLIQTEKGRQDLYSDIGGSVLDKYEKPTPEQIQKANEIATKLREFDERMAKSKSKEEWAAAAKEKNEYVWKDNREDIEKASRIWWASKWNKFRTVMKKPLMTYIYGAGDKTIRAKLYEELKIESEFANINETFIFMLYNDIRKVYKEELGAILDYKRLLTKVANRHYNRWKKASPEERKQLETLKFKHPYDGFPFHQRYLLPITGTTEIKYKGTDPQALKDLGDDKVANVSYTIKNQDLDQDTMETSIGANFTHFGDGGLVRYSILENDFPVDTVHDDFATTPSDTDALVTSLNNGMADLYLDINGKPVFQHIIEGALGEELTNEIFENDAFEFGDVNPNEFRAAQFAFGAGKAKKFVRDINSINEQSKQDIVDDIEERTKPC